MLIPITDRLSIPGQPGPSRRAGEHKPHKSGRHPASQLTRPSSALYGFIFVLFFQFSLMSLLLDPDPGECVDRPGAPHKPQSGSGMEERGPMHVSAVTSSGSNDSDVL